MNTKKSLPGFSYGKFHGYTFVYKIFPGARNFKVGDIILSVNGKTNYEEIDSEIQNRDLREFEVVRPGCIGIIRFRSSKDKRQNLPASTSGISDEQLTILLIESVVHFALQTDEIAHPESSAEIAAPTTKARWWRSAFDSIRSTVHHMVASNRTPKAVTP